MKALLLYSHNSGHKDFSRKLAYVRKELAGVFSEFEAICTFSEAEATRLEKKACAEDDVLIVAGGDGTFNHAVNVLMKEKRQPILGYLNFGTIGDVGRNFGIHGGLRRAVKIIKNGHIEAFDVGEINGAYFAYTCAIGAFSDIAYATPRKEKRRHGRLAYYWAAFLEAFKRKDLHYEITANSARFKGNTPFLMLLNGKNIGGFRVNSRGSINDGVMECYLVKPGLFNGLVHYFFHKHVQIITASEFDIKTTETGAWCLDGEAGPKGEAHVVLHPSSLRIFSRKLS
jgi:YegS/Rv2252/BmrU family lipid kinase